MRSSYQYRERDYAFGNLCLTLRTRIGVTQGEFAHLLGVSERALQSWEAGESYPKLESIKQLIAVCVQHHAFGSSRKEEEIRALWQAAHQRVLLDEGWLRTLLAPATVAQEAARQVTDEIVTAAGAIDTPVPAPPPASQPHTRIDWVGALDTSHFAGREVELADLSQWIVQEHCRLIAILGMGGIGKSALISLLGQQLAPQFEAVLWRSVRDAPSCDDLVADCITFCSDTPPAEFPSSLEQRIDQLVGRLQVRRCLLVLDNLETLLQEGDPEGNYRPGYEGYGRLVQRLGESAHQSCIVLTSREKPREIEALEGLRSPVRSLRLSGLCEEAARSLLEDKDLRGESSVWLQLIATYAGNPLALKIVGQAIVDLFGGDMEAFLQSGELIFNGIRAVLRQQVGRLTPLEQTLLTWLAVVREWTSLETLLSLQISRAIRGRVLEALEALSRRSLIEQGQQANFTLQSVVMEYIIDALLDQLTEEIVTQTMDHLRCYALEQAQAKDYVRESQRRLLVRPLIERLRSELRQDVLIEETLLRLLEQFRTEDAATQGYGPANVISLLKELRTHLRGLDFSRLSIRGAYLQGIEMQNAKLSGVMFRDTVFSDAFGGVSCVAISSDGRYWALGNTNGEVRIFGWEGRTLHLVLHAHTGQTYAVAFSPNGRILGSAGRDHLIQLWDTESGTLLSTLQGHDASVYFLAFAPDGQTLASSSQDGTVRIWNLSSKTCSQTLLGHENTVFSVAWNPDGRLLASSGADRSIRLWQVQTDQQGTRATWMQTLTGHTGWVMALAFAPDGQLLASASFDQTIKLWEVTSFQCLASLQSHTSPLEAIAWSPDGRWLASGGHDTKIWLWDAIHGREHSFLLGHRGPVFSLSFTPDSTRLLSGSSDRTLRVWETTSGKCIRVVQGYRLSMMAVAYSPDGRWLASGDSDATITLWNAVTRVPGPRLRGHTQAVSSVAWSPDGTKLASGSYDHTVRIWDTTTGACCGILQGHTHAIMSVTWSPDGTTLGSCSVDQTIRVWDVASRMSSWIRGEFTGPVLAIAWSPDGTRVASGGRDLIVHLWRAQDGSLLQTLHGHHESVRSLAWSPDGMGLASGSDDGTLQVWDASNGEVQHSLKHTQDVHSIAWSSHKETLISGSANGMIGWWNVESGACLALRQGDPTRVRSISIRSDDGTVASATSDRITLWNLQHVESLCTLRLDGPYERVDITGVQGLTEAQKATLRVLGAVEGSAALLTEP